MTVNQLAFSISVANTALPAQQIGVSQGPSGTDCNNDFLVIPGGFDPVNPTLLVPNMAFDRFCGERLNPRPVTGASVTVCSKFDFQVYCYALLLAVAHQMCFLHIHFCVSYDDSVSNRVPNEWR